MERRRSPARRTARALLALSALVAPRAAGAGGLALDLVSPRSVGRAGTAVVSGDGAGAVVMNPAGLARRDAVRAELALVVVDDDARYDGVGSGPVVDERGPTTAYPVAGGAGRLGPIVVGIAVLREASFARRFPAPEPGQPIEAVERLYPHRYAGLDVGYRRTTVGAGVAWRAAEWLAVGASLTLSRVELDETRRVWAGFGLRDLPIGGAARDLTVRLDGADPVVPGGSLGVLAAPVDVPIELAASVAWSDRARLDGGARVTDAFPGMPPVVGDAGASAEVELASPLVVRTGARWLGERWIVEVGGEITTYPRAGDDGGWAIRGVTVTDETGATGRLEAMRSQVVRRRHGAMRGALDVELVPGLLWLTGGWAWASAATPLDRFSPAAGDLGGHTAALGAELAADGFTVTLGVARTFVTQASVDVTRLRLDNPFSAGTAPTGLGHHDQSRDTIAVSVELELPE